MKLKVLAIDDEPLALRQMAAYVMRTPFLELAGQCSHAFEAMEMLQSMDIDLLLIDIQMPDLSGLDFVKSLAKRPMVIFTTAHSQYAVDGFKVDAVDYLLKPISYPDFLKAAQKAFDLWEMKEKLAVGGKEKAGMEGDFLFIKSEYRMIRVNFREIRYIEGMREYVRIHLIKDKPIMSLMSMKSLEEILPHNRFMRVHRSYMVNLDEVKIIERGRIVFDKEYIPIGDQYKKRFQEFLERR